MGSMQTLIDRAAEKCGSKQKVADALGITRQQLHNLYTGKTPVSAEQAGRLAMLSGVDVQRAILAAAVDEMRRTSRGRQVVEALERSFLAIAWVIFGIFATGSAVPGTSLATSVSQMMLDKTAIVLLRRLRRLIRSGRSPLALRNHVQMSAQPLAPT